MRRDVAKTCGLCGYAANDDADFNDHMREQHQWDQFVQRPEGRWSNSAVVGFTVLMTPLLLVPVMVGGLARLLGVVAFLIMFALVFRFSGLRVMLLALGFIAALYAGVLAFGLVLGLFLG